MKSFVPPEPLPPLYAESQSEARARKLHEQARKDAAWRATLHPTARLLAVHFHGHDRVAALVLGPAGGDAATTIRRQRAMTCWSARPQQHHMVLG